MYYRNPPPPVRSYWLICAMQNKFHEAVVDLSTSRVLRNVLLGPNFHANGDGDEIITIERTCLEDESVKAEIAKLRLPEGTVIISDPWIYGKNLS